MGHTEQNCWQKHPNLNPRRKRKPALIVSQEENAKYSEDLDVVCLFGKQEEHDNSRQDERFLDAGCSSHMMYSKSLFLLIQRRLMIMWS